MKSKRKPNTIGFSKTAGFVRFEDADYQNHWHIPGSTREGKSKFIEGTIEPLIGQNPIVLIDPSDNGATCYAVLKHCIAKNYQKVLLIDPDDFYRFIPCINPLRFRGEAAQEPVIETIMDSLRVLWSQASFDATPRIEYYLPHILSVLYQNNLPISKAIYFSVKDSKHKTIENERRKMLAKLNEYDESRVALEQIFEVSGKQQFITDFTTTVRRLSPFFKYYPRKLYSDGESIPFAKLIAEKWVILVNLDNTRVWSSIQSRLLGTIMVNEIVRAIHALRASKTGAGKPKNVWEGRCYLYIDEAGEFATRSLKRIMELKGKSGLWVRLAHQYDSQFRDREIAEAIHHLCKVQVRFSTPGDDKKRLKDMYYGPVKDTAEDILIPKQHCIIKIDKQPAVMFRVKDIKTPEISDQAIEDFKSKIYNQPWFTAHTNANPTSGGKRGQTVPAQKTHPQSVPREQQPPVHQDSTVKAPPVDRGKRRPDKDPQPESLPTKSSSPRVVPSLVRKRPAHAQADGGGGTKKDRPEEE